MHTYIYIIVIKQMKKKKKKLRKLYLVLIHIINYAISSVSYYKSKP